MQLKPRDDRQYRALLGLSEKKFEALLHAFEIVYEETQEAAYQASLGFGRRQRRPGGGQKGH